MVKDEQKWIRLFEKFKKDKLADKLRFQLADLENYIKSRLGGASAYQAAGGYQNFYQFLKKLEAESKIRTIKSSDFNQRQPRLKKRWTLLKEESSGWPEKEILKLSRELKLNYYLKRPEQQTVELKQKLFSLCQFLNNKAQREWASREERSLELFADEKFLSRSEGKKLLSNLNLSLADLKAQQYNHLFVYWTLNSDQIKNILIMENHSAFIGAKKALAAGIDIFEQNFETVIYGQGKKIVSSFSFLEELLGIDKAEQQPGAENFKQNLRRQDLLAELNIYYAGDLDPEGLAIFSALNDKYPDFEIKLLAEYYQLLLNEADQFYSCQKRQNKNQQVLARVQQDFREQGFAELAEELQQIWKNDLRLPQELVTLEVYKKYFAEKSF